MRIFDVFAHHRIGNLILQAHPIIIQVSELLGKLEGPLPCTGFIGTEKAELQPPIGGADTWPCLHIIGPFCGEVHHFNGDLVAIASDGEIRAFTCGTSSAAGPRRRSAGDA